ncbi:MAG TPA: response regulator [Thermodesulfobacteriota bacterium]|nr:response regulator [Thermodesulfobacteriota bacterium]
MNTSTIKPEKSKTILILEDEMIIAKSIKSYIEKIGYSVAGIAQNGSDAIQIAEQYKPDLAILDVVVDGDMDGIETGRELLKLNVPFLYLTAYGDTKTRQRAKETKPLGYIIKPFNDTVILNTIKEAFEQIESSKSK